MSVRTHGGRVLQAMPSGQRVDCIARVQSRPTRHRFIFTAHSIELIPWSDQANGSV